MKLVFGLSADGGVFPTFPGDGNGVLNEEVVGPGGLVRALETQLGLTGPVTLQAVRTAGYLRKLKAAAQMDESVFYAASLRKDPWGTARLLLGWRDDLTLSGWDGAATGAARPDVLAAVEQIGPALAPGLGDRVQAILKGLSDRPLLALQQVSHVEPAELIPFAWRKLFEALESCGVVIAPILHTNCAAGGDLQRLQAFLEVGATSAFDGDGSLAFIEADTSLLAAEAIAEWLAAAPEDQADEVVVLCPDGDSALLDQALRTRGLPALGQSAASPWRGALQVLPLAFAIAWQPFDPKPLLDLLHLPRSPVAPMAANRLAYALSREPGRGGQAWARAWSRIEENLKERFSEHPEADAEISSRLSRWRVWTDGASHDRTSGMPAGDARAIASRVAEWAIQADAGKGDPLLLKLAGAARALIEAIGELGEERLPALLLERMIAEILADGVSNPDHRAEAGALRCVCEPAALWGAAKTVIWWGFTGQGVRPRGAPWDNEERTRLSAAGVRLDPLALETERLSFGYAQAARMASARLIFVRPALSADEETTSHPLAHQIQPMLELGGETVTWRAEQILEQPQSLLAGRLLERRAASATRPPAAKGEWTVPTPLAAAIAERSESATSLEHLLECQLRWILREVARLSSGSVGDLPNPNQLIGNVVHELANQVLPPGPLRDPGVVQAEVSALFDAVVGDIAAPLLQPEFAGDLARARTQAPAALGKLAGLLKERGFAVVGTELSRAAELGGGLKVHGRLDLLVEKNGDPVVVDLKWTRSARRRVSEVAEGRAVQLAAYGAMARPGDATPAPGGFFLLNQRRMVADQASGLSDDPIEGPRTTAQTWDAVLEAWRAWRALASDGRAVATGIIEALPDPAADLPLKPGEAPCTYCELTAVCRVGALEV
jgi:ATP-dependent helicase/nuclease subunit B